MKKVLFLASFLVASFAHAEGFEQPVPYTAGPYQQFSSQAPFLLASSDVGPNEQVYRFDVENCANDLAAVKLKVSGAAVHADKVGVVFIDKATRQFTINKTYSAGTESRWLNLGIFRAMDPRCVTQIFATAHSIGGVARVEVWAQPK